MCSATAAGQSIQGRIRATRAEKKSKKVELIVTERRDPVVWKPCWLPGYRWPATGSGLSPADRCKYRNCAAIRDGSAQTVRESNVLIVDEHVDVLSHFAALIHHAIERSGSSLAERSECVPHCRARLIDDDVRLAVHESAERGGKLDRYHGVT